MQYVPEYLNTRSYILSQMLFMFLNELLLQVHHNFLLLIKPMTLLRICVSMADLGFCDQYDTWSYMVNS